MTRTHVLNFHGIGTPGRALEQGEAPYWITADLFAGIVELVAGRPDRAHIAITFDDGNASDLAIAAPLLEAHGLAAEIFVLADRLDQPGSLSRRDLGTLQEMGMTIGSHGAAHTDWRRLDGIGQTREFEEARAEIADAAGTPVSAAAIPFGAYNAGVLRALRPLGYARVYTSDGGAMRPGAWLCPRTSVRDGMTLDTVRAILDGHMTPLRRLRRGLGMLKRRVL